MSKSSKTPSASKTIYAIYDSSNDDCAKQDKEVNGIIYKATLINDGRVYIGETCKSLKIRINQHKQKAKNPKQHFHYALRKYGLDAFKWEIIDNSNNYLALLEKEVYYIKFYKSNDRRFGFNSTSGGEHTEFTEDVKKKISESGKNSYKNGRIHHYLGKNRSKEDIEKIKLSHQKHAKKIICITNGTIYGSLHDASKNLNIRKYKIKMCVDRKWNQTHGFQFKYYNKNESIGNIKTDFKTSKGIAKKVICKETNEIFNSIHEAGKKYNRAPSNIYESIKYGRPCANMHFGYFVDAGENINV